MSREIADQTATDEFEKYELERSKQLDSQPTDFDKAVKAIAKRKPEGTR